MYCASAKMKVAFEGLARPRSETSAHPGSCGPKMVLGKQQNVVYFLLINLAPYMYIYIYIDPHRSLSILWFTHENSGAVMMNSPEVKSIHPCSAS